MTITNEIDRLIRKADRQKELYESALAVVRKYQCEREALLHRVNMMAIGAYISWVDQIVSLIPVNVYIVCQYPNPSSFEIIGAFFTEKSAREFVDDCVVSASDLINTNVVKIPLHVGDHFENLKKGVVK